MVSFYKEFGILRTKNKKSELFYLKEVQVKDLKEETREEEREAPIKLSFENQRD